MTEEEARIAFNNRYDLSLIAEHVETGARVLDVGSGNGDLLELLEQTRNADARGIEISQSGVNACVARGLSVIQGDADTDLIDYPDQAFDVAILSQTIQATKAPDLLLEQLLRISEKVIVSFPNFGHWKVRLGLMLTGRMPVTKSLNYKWYDTPNIHLCTIKDFRNLCDSLNTEILHAYTIDEKGHRMNIRGAGRFSNLFGESAVFIISPRRV